MYRSKKYKILGEKLIPKKKKKKKKRRKGKEKEGK